VGASGKLGRYMVRHALDRGYEVAGVCREQSVAKLDAFAGRMTVIPGATDDREVIREAVAGCGGVLTVLVPRGVHGYSTGTAQAVLDHAAPGARLVFSCGWHISRDGQDVCSRRLRWKVHVLGGFGKLVRAVDLDDQVEACRRVFASDTRWTVVRGSLIPGTGTGRQSPAGPSRQVPRGLELGLPMPAEQRPVSSELIAESVLRSAGSPMREPRIPSQSGASYFALPSGLRPGAGYSCGRVIGTTPPGADEGKTAAHEVRFIQTGGETGRLCGGQQPG